VTITLPRFLKLNMIFLTDEYSRDNSTSFERPKYDLKRLISLFKNFVLSNV